MNMWTKSSGKVYFWKGFSHWTCVICHCTWGVVLELTCALHEDRLTWPKTIVRSGYLRALITCLYVQICTWALIEVCCRLPVWWFTSKFVLEPYLSCTCAEMCLTLFRQVLAISLSMGLQVEEGSRCQIKAFSSAKHSEAMWSKCMTWNEALFPINLK